MLIGAVQSPSPKGEFAWALNVTVHGSEQLPIQMVYTDKRKHWNEI